MKKGYSLIELILVVGAVILIAAFGMARYNEFNERQSVRQAADTFISNLRLIQVKALAGDKPAGCETLVGWTVEFSEKSYSMYAICNNGGIEVIIEGSRMTVDLPGFVNLSPSAGYITYYALGRGSSQDQTVQIVGRQITIPVVLSSSSNKKDSPTETTIAVATPTPMPVSCPWPAGDPRCGDYTPPGGSPTPTVSQDLCQGGGVQSYSVDTPCPPANYRYIHFTCNDGYSVTAGTPISCKTESGWYGYATQECTIHLNCPWPPTTPTPTP